MKLEQGMLKQIRKVLSLVVCVILASGCSVALQGDNGLTVVGNSTSNTVTLALDGTVVRGVLTDSGNATGSDNWLSMLGAGNVTISASGSTITISCEGESGGNATYALDSDKLDGQHGSYYLTTTGTAADSTLFYGFTALQWTDIIDAQIVSGTSADSDKLDGQHGSYYLTATGTSAVKAWRSTPQTLTKQIWQKINCNSEYYDVASEYDSETNYRFTCAVSGYYYLAGQVTLDLCTVGKELCMAVGNGSPASSLVYFLVKGDVPTSRYPVVSGSTIQYLVVGDKVELWAEEMDTTDKALVINGVTTLTVVRLW